METLTYQDIIAQYKRKFGQEPEITGSRFWDSEQIIEDLLDCIETGVRYAEPPIPEGADV